MADKKSDYFTSYQEAQKAYEKWKKRDPFEDIPSALLNSADIEDYVRLTGMIYPFHKEDLIGATYSVRLKGLCVYYEEKTQPGEKNNHARSSKKIEHVFCIGKDMDDLPNAKNNRDKAYEIKDKLVLEPNSITFVTLEPVFQIPDYLAFRFNLRISHVYKGLLLGTGPIIDPGFQGRLSIPLHNLTSNRYTLSENDVIISLEITKMSPYPKLKKYKFCRKGEYVPTSIAPHRQVMDYLQNALGQRIDDGVVSSVIAATNDIRITADEAENKAKNAEDKANNAENVANDIDRKINRWGIIGTIIALIAIVASIVGLLIPVYTLVGSIKDIQKESEIRIHDLENEIADLKLYIEELLSKDNTSDILTEESQDEDSSEHSEGISSDED